MFVSFAWGTEVVRDDDVESPGGSRRQYEKLSLPAARRGGNIKRFLKYRIRCL